MFVKAKPWKVLCIAAVAVAFAGCSASSYGTRRFHPTRAPSGLSLSATVVNSPHSRSADAAWVIYDVRNTRKQAIVVDMDLLEDTETYLDVYDGKGVELPQLSKWPGDGVGSRLKIAGGQTVTVAAPFPDYPVMGKIGVFTIRHRVLPMVPLRIENTRVNGKEQLRLLE